MEAAEHRSEIEEEEKEKGEKNKTMFARHSDVKHALATFFGGRRRNIALSELSG